MSACRHVANLKPLQARTVGCEGCEASGDRWVHLRICMSCGYVGCCDSSKNKHATAHHHDTQHPIVRSFEKGERWGWCYFDQQELGDADLPRFTRR